MADLLEKSHVRCKPPLPGSSRRVSVRSSCSPANRGVYSPGASRAVSFPRISCIHCRSSAMLRSTRSSRSRMFSPPPTRAERDWNSARRAWSSCTPGIAASSSVSIRQRLGPTPRRFVRMPAGSAWSFPLATQARTVRSVRPTSRAASRALTLSPMLPPPVRSFPVETIDAKRPHFASCTSARLTVARCLWPDHRLLHNTCG